MFDRPNEHELTRCAVQVPVSVIHQIRDGIKDVRAPSICVISDMSCVRKRRSNITFSPAGQHYCQFANGGGGLRIPIGVYTSETAETTAPRSAVPLGAE